MDHKEKYRITDKGRICSSCNEWKEWDCFSKNNNNYTKREGCCKECKRIKYKEYYTKNKEDILLKNAIWEQNNITQRKEYFKEYSKKNFEKISEYGKTWRLNNLDLVLENHRKYYHEHKEEKRKYYLDNKDHITAYRKEHYKKNFESISKKYKEYREKNINELNLKQTEYQKSRLKNDPYFRLTRNIRRRVHLALFQQEAYKQDKTFSLIGCSPEVCRQHLESQFIEDMSWDNYGLHGWHVDHIIPCNYFDLENPLEQYVCFNWKNLQPLWYSKNIAKNDILPDNGDELYSEILEGVLQSHPELKIHIE